MRDLNSSGKNKTNILICFIGVDGSGKTTLATELTRVLEKSNMKTAYVHSLIKPILLRPFIMLGRLIFLRRKDRFNNYLDFSDTKRKALKKYRFVYWPYYYLLLLDYFPQIFFRVRIPLMLGRTVICDRYVHDTLINMALNLSFSYEKTTLIIRKVFKLFPRPEMTYLIDVPEEIAFQRKDDIPSVDYLKDRRKMYMGIQKGLEIERIDGSLNLPDLIRIVETKTINHMRSRDEHGS